jgi:opacity protein-like surface antigen
LAATLCLAFSSPALAADGPADAAAQAPTASATLVATGPYLGIGLGFSKLGPRHAGGDGGHANRPEVAKLYGGYRLSDTWGVEAGMARLGPVHNDTTAADGSTLHHNGQASSLYLAGTGRMALGQGVSLTGKAGVSFGRVSANSSGDTDFTLAGHQAAPLLGVGADYQVQRNLALTVDLEGYGKVSKAIKAATATVGLRYGF